MATQLKNQPSTYSPFASEEESKAPPIESRLGPIVFQQSKIYASSVPVIVISLILGSLFSFYSLWMGLGLAISGCGIAVLGSVFHGKGLRRFSVHELGISLEEKHGLEEIGFDEVVSFSFHSAAVVYDGEYQGHRKVVKIVGQQSNNQVTKIVFETITKETKPWLRLKDRIAEGMGLNMAAELAECDCVEWSPGSFISRDGIETAAIAGFTKDVVKFAWDQIRSMEFKKSGQLLVIRIADEKYTRVVLKTGKPNFHPGYFLFRRLLELNNAEALS